MNVLLTFDYKRQIRHVIAGWPGSVHDSTIWGTSSPALRPDEYFSSNQYQAGDSGFPLGMRMLTPYRLPYSSASGNDAFNTGHASLRVVCEHGNDVKTACNWILACCILHNVVNRPRNGEDTVPLFVEEVRPNTECKSDVVDGCLIWRENIKSELLKYLGLDE
ncbi:hypothetical protein DYB31_010806 [Aphanomyces astaci]|uniref:DDE Tnp4 domain-containing protein n=1 Tax=Aphanomyces astaci TaxID=112090 RepID=A0A397EP79_APHAT|nr:hypothetical protein DYB31_010806 [Aphanomyces astaci]